MKLIISIQVLATWLVSQRLPTLAELWRIKIGFDFMNGILSSVLWCFKHIPNLYGMLIDYNSNTTMDMKLIIVYNYLFIFKTNKKTFACSYHVTTFVIITNKK
jgi:hypothetical protein